MRIAQVVFPPQGCSMLTHLTMKKLQLAARVIVFVVAEEGDARMGTLKEVRQGSDESLGMANELDGGMRSLQTN